MVRAVATLAATTVSSDRPSHHALEEDVLREAALKVTVLLVLGQPADDQQRVVQHPESPLATDLRMENLRVTDRHTVSRLEIEVLVPTVPRVERVRNAPADLVRNAPVALTAVGARSAAVAAIVPVHPERAEHPARVLLETVAHLAAEALVRAARIPGESASLS